MKIRGTRSGSSFFRHSLSDRNPEAIAGTVVLRYNFLVLRGGFKSTEKSPQIVRKVCGWIKNIRTEKKRKN
jgi:hypothetical protein